MSDYNLVLIRHGQSLWNKQNRFTGWADIDLSDQGIKEARRAGILLKEAGLQFDLACSSVLKRAIRTLWLVLEELDQMWLPVIKSWRLNERHYGALTGLNKLEITKKYGEKQVQLWRRDYETSPPLLEESRDLKKNKHYQIIKSHPLGESLKETKQRVLPIWEKEIIPLLKEGKKILLVAHGNSLRAFIKQIENLSNEEITKVEIPTGTPIAYPLSTTTLKPSKTGRKIFS